MTSKTKDRIFVWFCIAVCLVTLALVAWARLS